MTEEDHQPQQPEVEEFDAVIDDRCLVAGAPSIAFVDKRRYQMSIAAHHMASGMMKGHKVHVIITNRVVSHIEYSDERTRRLNAAPPKAEQKPETPPPPPPPAQAPTKEQQFGFTPPKPPAEPPKTPQKEEKAPPVMTTGSGGGTELKEYVIRYSVDLIIKESNPDFARQKAKQWIIDNKPVPEDWQLWVGQKS